MSALSKLRAALNLSARPGETVKITKGMLDSTPPVPVLHVELTVFRYDCRPPMDGRLTLTQDVAELLCGKAQGGYPAIADALWGKLRESASHPDHPSSHQALLAKVAAATGMDVAAVEGEVLEAAAEEFKEGMEKMRGGLRDTGKGFTVRSSPAAAQPDPAQPDAGPGESPKETSP
jgi:hypothetical protein